MTRLRTILLLILISLMVTLSVQLTEQFSTQTINQADNSKAREVDYSIQNFNLTTMDTSGQTRYHLNAASMLHYQESDETSLEKLNIDLFREPRTHWNIQSSKGSVAAHGKSVDLSGKVVIKRGATPAQNELVITTSALHIDVEKNIVSTKQLIKLTSAGVNIQSKGLLANMNKQTINLLAKVRGTYAPIH